MNSITTLPIPDSTVSPLQWGTNPDPSDQNSGRVFLTVDPETGYTHIWSWDRNEWLQLRLTAGEDLDLVADPKREALLAEAVDLLKWMNDNGRLLCDAGIRWRAQEVIKTYEG